MRVLFIHSNNSLCSSPKPITELASISIGISILAAVLKRDGHTVRVAVLTRGTPPGRLENIVDDFKPELLAFTAVASEYEFIEKTARRLRRHYPRIFQIIGGVHVSLNPRETMLDVFDALCIGEGEGALSEFVAALEKGECLSAIANIWLKRPDGSVEKNPVRPFIEDLDSLPFADRAIWDEWIDLEKCDKRPALVMGRGCPFLCSYCSNHALKGLAGGKYVRLRSPGNIITELRAMTIASPWLNDVTLEIETLGVDLAWSFALCEALAAFNRERSSPLTFAANIRITPAFRAQAESLFAAMKSAGFRLVHIGLESGSPRLREEILNRRYANDDVVYASDTAHKHDLGVMFFLLIGLPTETPEEHSLTVAMTKRCLPEVFSFSIFSPYPGTRLFEMCKEMGANPPETPPIMERWRAVLGFPGFSRAKIQKAFLWFHFYVLYGLRDKPTMTRIIFDRYKKAYRTTWERLTLPIRIALDIFSPWRRTPESGREKELFWPLFRRWVGHWRDDMER